MEVFKLFGTLGLKGASDVDKQLDGTVGKAQGAGTKLTAAAVAIGTAVGNLVVKGAAAITANVGDAMKSSDALQKYASTMKFAGFKDSEINSSRNAFKKYADDTVYDLDTITNTGAQLAANGIKNFQSLTTSAGNLNAVAGGNAETFKSVAMTMTQTAGAGKLTTENWNQLADAIPGASGMLQKAMKDNGAYTGNFREAMEKGQITSEEFNQAIEQLGSKPIAVEAAKSTATFEGAIGNLQATVTTGLMNIIDAFGKGGMTNAITGFGNGVGKAFDGAVQWIGKAKQFMSDLWQKMQENGAISAFQGGFNNVKAAIDQAVNIAKNFFSSISGGASQKQVIDNIGNAVKGVGDFVQDVTGKMSDFLGWFSKGGAGVDALKAAVVGLTGAWTAYKVITGALQIIETARNTIMKLMLSYSAAAAIKTGALTVAQGAQMAMTEGSTAAFALFNAVLNGNPIGLIITAIVALVAALAFFFTKTETGRKIWSSFIDWLKGAWESVSQFFSGLWDGIVQMFDSAVDSVQGAWRGVSEFFTGLWNSIGQVFNSAVSAISAVVTPAFNAIATGIQVAMNLIWSIIQIAWQLVKVAVELVVGGLVAYIKFSFETWATIITTVMNIIKNIIMTVWNFISPFVMGVVNGIKNTITTVWNAIQSVVSTAMNGIKAVISTVWNAIQSTISTVMTAIKSVIMSIWNAISPFVTTAVNGIKNTVTTVWNAIKLAITTVMNAVKSVITTVWDSVKSTVTTVVNAIKNTIQTVFNTIKSVTTSIFNAVKSTITSVWNSIKSTISSVVNAISSTISSVFNSIKSTISNVVNSIKSTVTSVFNGIKSAMTAPIEAAKSVISGIVNAIKGLFNFKISFPPISIPKIPMPHFKISGEFNPLKGQIPSIGVDWYAKGGIMNGATLFGMNGNNLMMGGEAGREAILPLNKETLGQIGDQIVASTDGMGSGGMVFNQYNYSPENMTPREAAKYAKQAGKDMLKLLNK
ncbi:hypothetical protein COC69_05720 [Bacillus cereus]|uniref:Tape measure protein N-terminal domain-containing protein n=1 Tax=Bacillus cereus TaxID=1396 RepID=A0A9X7CR86_BACCE|nr:tape measure protein [Bacillus cereus]PGS81628.1 hypothetical protein COC69_05720 [Bacillus cereus]